MRSSIRTLEERILERVMAVTLEELTEFGWEDYLNEEMYEEALENYVEKAHQTGCNRY